MAVWPGLAYKDGMKRPGDNRKTAARPAPCHEQADALLGALEIRPSRYGRREAAAFRALAEEVLHLREEGRQLRAALDAAELLADRDSLCPVFNRRAFLRELGREMALARRHGTPLCLIYLDLDRFKLVNDRLGHSRGDEVLQRVSAVIQSNVRETDIIGRLGGDEFAVILSHASHRHARHKAALLEERVSEIAVRAGGEGQPALSLRIGASCGVAEWDGQAAPGTLISQADEAMFRAKARRISAGE